MTAPKEQRHQYGEGRGPTNETTTEHAFGLLSLNLCNLI